MPLTGTLKSWNDDRGFGFITPTGGGSDLFVHISAFPRDGSRPTAGELLSYEVGQGRDGKPAAVRVYRQTLGRPSAYRPRQQAAGTSRRSVMGSLIPSGVGLRAGCLRVL
jgi:cold shock CspA family protein